MNTIQQLSTAELRRLERIYETDKSLDGSIMLRGIRSEIDGREDERVDIRHNELELFDTASHPQREQLSRCLAEMWVVLISTVFRLPEILCGLLLCHPYTRR